MSKPTELTVHSLVFSFIHHLDCSVSQSGLNVQLLLFIFFFRFH